jgi:hypothetical protein
MATFKAPPDVPKKGEIAFEHYYVEQPGSEHVKRAKGSSFKSTIVGIEYKEEGIMYTVRHVTDDFTNVAHISDFVAMTDGSYPRMKKIAKADNLGHKTWLRIMDEF